MQGGGGAIPPSLEIAGIDLSVQSQCVCVLGGGADACLIPDN